MYYLRHIWAKVRYRHFAWIIIDSLTKMGVRISPYYIVLEGLFNSTIEHLESGFKEYDIGFLTPIDMGEMSAIPGPDRPFTEECLLQRLKKDQKCLGIKHMGRIVAFTWFDLNEFHCTFCKIPLKEDEAYLFDAYTIMDYRGKGLAPYMRYQCYKKLASLGMDRLYSVSECCNTPSIKFKMKLKAEIIELCLYVELFKRWSFNTRLKSYKNKFKHYG